MELGSDDPFGSPSEGSGWTTYLLDFSDGRYCSSSYCSSLVSDAASHARRPSPNANDKIKTPKKENLVKKTTRRTGEISCEDPLEDTASSPVNSPRGKDGGGSWEKSGLGYQVDQGRGNIEHKEEHSSDLKKRGLCLVPLSSLFMG